MDGMRLQGHKRKRKLKVDPIDDRKEWKQMMYCAESTQFVTRAEE